MRDTLIRINGTDAYPAGSYVKSCGHDGSFSITGDRYKARRWVRTTAFAKIGELSQGQTRMTFGICPAPGFAP